MKRNRFFLSLLFMVLIVLFVILFFTWLGRENIKNDSAIRDVAKEEVDKLFLFIIKGSMLRYMICHVTLSKMPLREKIF